MKNNNLNITIANNLVFYRKKLNLTQLELSILLSYSDKSISKWENGDGVPDIFVLYKLAEIFGITVNDLLSEKKVKQRAGESYIKQKRVIISLLSVGLVWLVATILFALGFLFKISIIDKIWLVYIYAIPLSAIIMTVYTSIWRKTLLTFLFSSIICWSIALSLFLSLEDIYNFMYFIIAIPVQAILLLVFYLLSRKNKTKIIKV